MFRSNRIGKTTNGNSPPRKEPSSKQLAREWISQVLGSKRLRNFESLSVPLKPKGTLSKFAHSG
jgi:hypothetical protein